MSSTAKPDLISPSFSYDAPSIVTRDANIQDYQAEYERSIKDPEAFWAAEAANFT